MFVRHLSLSNFRSYESADIALGPGVTVFTGANGQGKTNLVEAVEYISTGGSHRVSSTVPLVRAGAAGAVIRVRAQAGVDDDREVLLEVEITPGKAGRARLNRSAVRRAREIVGILRTVVFSPEDLTIVKGDPAERRRFIDELVTTRWPRLAGVRADYERVLRQRSALLKSLGGNPRRAEADDVAITLDAWDGQLARHGGELLAARLSTLAELHPYLQATYETIAPVKNAVAAAYASRVDLPDSVDPAGLAAALGASLRARRGDEVARGLCLVGPHRDDITFTIGDLPARGYASHGESWSLALALRLAANELLLAEGGRPVLVLDDVFAELDATRRDRLAAQVAAAEQVLITAAVPEDVPAALRGARFQVHDGEVIPGVES
ncbi:DNA replication/repair protein RecF [Propionicicella superfundia]|uniref:DNA replication/repair protein RecF n=1 Tax=Propionicicella superfundia TaxID=348582 RepID=UPI00040CC46C|nr:DNA replication/repair protein RecF [Propionicicella superfundia]